MTTTTIMIVTVMVVSVESWFWNAGRQDEHCHDCKAHQPHLASDRLDFQSPGFFDASDAMEAHMELAVAQGTVRRWLFAATWLLRCAGSAELHIGRAQDPRPKAWVEGVADRQQT